jgi:hypothetical protein
MRLERLVVLDHETLLGGGDGATVRLPCRPDRSAARRVTEGLLHLGWVRIDVTGRHVSAELLASARRPVRRPLPVPAALALAESGVPTLVVRGAAR